MPVTTSQQLSNYFEEFSGTEVTFTKEVIQATRLNPSGVHLRCLGDQWPCVVYSSSMTSARIIANLQPSLNETLRKANNSVSLRFSFSEPDKPEPMSFFVKAKTAGFTPYGKEKPSLYFANLTFSQRPPDDLISIIGGMLEAKENSKRRAEWRLPLSAAIVKKIGIVLNRTWVTSDQGRKPAILRDISFSGCKAIVADASDKSLNKRVTVNLTFQEPDEVFEIAAKVCRLDPVDGHEDIAVVGFQYDEERIPMAYKLRINTVIRSQRNNAGE